MRCKRNILVLSCLDFWRNKLCLKIFGIPAQVLSDFERSRVQKYLSSYGHWRPNLLVVDSFFGIDVVTSSWATIIFWIGSKTPMAMVPCWVFPCWLHYVGFRMVVLRDWDVSKCQVWLVNTTGAGSNDGKLYLGRQKFTDLDLEMNMSWTFSVKDLEMVPMTRMTQMFLVVSIRRTWSLPLQLWFCWTSSMFCWTQCYWWWVCRTLQVT